MTLTIDDLLTALREGRTITGGSPLHEVMHQASQEALRITAELNGAYHAPERVRELLSELIGAPVDESVTVFPPPRRPALADRCRGGCASRCSGSSTT